MDAKRFLFVCAVSSVLAIGACDEDPVNDLVNDLESRFSNVEERVAAAEQLAQMSDPRASAALLRALNREESPVVRAAIGALAQRGDEQAVEPLLIKLKTDSDPKNQVALVAALGQLGDARAVPLVATRLTESFPFEVAVEALARLGAPAVPVLLDEAKARGVTSEQGRKILATVTTVTDRKAVDVLINRLTDLDDEVRVAVTTALGNIGDERAVLPLIDLIENCQDSAQPAKGETWITTPESRFRMAAASALGRLGDRRAIEPLQVAAQRCHAGLQGAALTALADLEVSDRKTVDLAHDALMSAPSPELNKVVAMAMARMGHRGPALLIEYTTGVSSYTFTGPRDALLAESGRPGVQLALFEALEQDKSEVRAAAAELITESGLVLPHDRLAQYQFAREDWDGLVETGAAAVPMLIRHLEWRPEVSQTLERIGPAAAAPLAEKMRGLSPSGRMLAARILGRLGDPVALPVLEQTLHYDSDDGVFLAAATAMGKLGGSGVARLGRGLGVMENTEHRRHVIAVLSATRRPEAVPFLIAEFQSHGSEDGEVIRALSGFGSLARDAVPQLMAHVGEGKAHWADAVVALGKLGDQSVRPFLIALLGDWESSPPAAQALDELGWTPHSDRQWILYYGGRRARLELLAYWTKAHEVLKAEIASGDRLRINNAVRILIGLGRQESLEDLTSLLADQGWPELAALYAQSGHDGLAQAAIQWTEAEKTDLSAVELSVPVRWGAL
ncbi:hypothetical protein JCM17960_16170 [Magnetospira thiophila]